MLVFKTQKDVAKFKRVINVGRCQSIQGAKSALSIRDVACMYEQLSIIFKRITCLHQICKIAFQQHSMKWEKYSSNPNRSLILLCESSCSVVQNNQDVPS